jgi:hypothetical protein
MEEKFSKVISSAIKRSTSSSEIFDNFIYEVINYRDTPATNLTELRQKTKRNKYKGHLFEFFCKKYFEKIIKVDNIWLIKECPINILKELNLTKRDFGIDLIIYQNGKFSPIQCKFKSPKKLRRDLEMKFHYQNVTWRDLSTFYSLCDRSGPREGWEKLIVFTNSKYVNRKGKKNHKDHSICYNSLKNLTIEDFKNLAFELDNIVDQKINNEKNNLVVNKETPNLTSEEEIREKRMSYFLNKKTERNDENILNNINN